MCLLTFFVKNKIGIIIHIPADNNLWVGLSNIVIFY